MNSLDNLSYHRFCSKSNLHKALNTLYGIISGVGMDAAVNESELDEIRKWCEEQRRYQKMHPFNELMHIMDNALEDGVLDSEEISDILWFLEKATSENEFYDIVTSDLQKLQGVLHGILADGVVEESEVKILSEWLEGCEHLRGCYPYDEIYSALADVLADGVVDQDEAEFLKAFFAEFVSLSFSNQNKVSKDLKVSVTSLGVCAVSPEITFEQKKFCFTGESWKATRSQLKQIVEEANGLFTNRIAKDLDYLVYGASGNQCWAYSCYGRKVEKVLQMIKEGSSALIVHEDDLWKVIEGAGISFP
jgi:NAD-dependent DNA ligase